MEFCVFLSNNDVLVLNQVNTPISTKVAKSAINIFETIRGGGGLPVKGTGVQNVKGTKFCQTLYHRLR